MQNDNSVTHLIVNQQKFKFYGKNSLVIEEKEIDLQMIDAYSEGVDALDENDDVQNVFSNFEISDETMAKLDG